MPCTSRHVSARVTLFKKEACNSFVTSILFSIINDFKDTMRVMKFDSGIALKELEHYRLNIDSEGLTLYNKVDSLQNLPNPLLYWRYYSSQNYEVLHLIARKVFSILTSSSVCGQNFRNFKTWNIFIVVGDFVQSTRGSTN